MSLQNQIKVWLLLLAIVILGLWMFSSILLPFVVGMALAYLLDPMADRLEKWKFSRFWATTVLLAVVVIIVAGAFVLIVPLVLQQGIGLVQKFPGYIKQLQEIASDFIPEVYALLGAERVVQVQNASTDALTGGLGIVGNVFSQVMQSGITLINALGLLVVTPVVAFYLLLDWDRMVVAANELLPVKNAEEIRGVLRDIDKAMAGVIRGQVSVVLLLSAFYGISLTLTGLSFGLAIGLIAGLLSFIPYVGFLVGFVLSIGVALVQFWPEWPMVAVVFAIFIVGQFLEGNVLYPKLVGGSIGVHPVWLMFALFAFGLIFGFLGLLLAVPMAAIASVMIRYGVRKYMESPLYLGTDGGPGGQTPTSE